MKNKWKSLERVFLCSLFPLYYSKYIYQLTTIYSYALIILQPLIHSILYTPTWYRRNIICPRHKQSNTTNHYKSTRQYTSVHVSTRQYTSVHVSTRQNLIDSTPHGIEDSITSQSYIWLEGPSPGRYGLKLYDWLIVQSTNSEKKVHFKP